MFRDQLHNSVAQGVQKPDHGSL